MSKDNKAPFSNMDKFKVNNDFLNTGATEEMLSKVPISKPNKKKFVHANPEESYTVQIRCIEDNEGQLYYVSDNIAGNIPELCATYRITHYITRQGNSFLWPVKLSTWGDKLNGWAESALKAVEEAKDNWIRICAEKELNGYKIIKPKAQLESPIWPSYSMEELLETAFEGRVIDSMDNPLIKELEGRV